MLAFCTTHAVASRHSGLDTLCANFSSNYWQLHTHIMLLVVTLPFPLPPALYRSTSGVCLHFWMLAITHSTHFQRPNTNLHAHIVQLCMSPARPNVVITDNLLRHVR